MSRPKHRNSSRYYLERLLRQTAERVAPGQRVLDAGAGHCPYRDLFAHAAYETADFCQVDKRYGQIDYVCDLQAIPVESQRYDWIICTQVLEHVANPAAVLAEFGRLLGEGGHLLLSAPLYYEEHEQPHDYYRYTQFGLTHQLRLAGFAIERLEWLEGYYGTLAHQFRKAGRNLPSRPSAYGGGLVGTASAAAAMALKPTLSLLARWMMRLDVRAKHTATGHCINYAVLAQKQAARQAAA